MVDIGSAVGAGMKVASSIFGGVQASKAMKAVKKNLESQRNENADWYNRRYNEDATERASAQAVLNKVREDIQNRNKQAAAAAAVSGGTEESLAAAKAANNDALAQTMTNVAVNAEARKDAIESQYRSTDSALQGQLNNLEINKAQALMQAAEGVADAAGSLQGNLGVLGK